MLVVGITGPTGAGKSEVCRLLDGWERISIIDCDQVARQVVQRGEHCLLDLAVEFSSAIITKDGELNRRKLAAIVFNDRQKLLKMEKIIYPYIIARIIQNLSQQEKAGSRAVFLDAPTLYQSGAHILCQRVVAVLAPEAGRLERIMERDNLTVREARARMSSQPGNEYYEKRADHIIHNIGEISALRLAVLELQNKLGL